jgi:hypothetical protein
MEAASAPPQNERTHDKGTDYIVFRQAADETWSQYSQVKAASSTAAIRQCVMEPGDYVAIPARSFKPTRAQVSTETVVKLG